MSVDAVVLQGTMVPVAALLAVACPHCHAPPGARCRGSLGPVRPSQSHKTRADAAKEAAATAYVEHGVTLMDGTVVTAASADLAAGHGQALDVAAVGHVACRRTVTVRPDGARAAYVYSRWEAL